MAEAEVEYEDKKSDAIDVAFRTADEAQAAKLAMAFRLERCYPSRPTSLSGPRHRSWTIPANQALNIHPEVDYALVDAGDKSCWCWLLDFGRGLPFKRYELSAVLAIADGQGRVAGRH